MLSGTKTRDPAARTSPARRSARCSSRRHPLLLPQDRLARAPQPGDAGPGDHPRSTPSRHSLPFTSTTSPARLGRLWRLLLHPLGGALSTPLLQPRQPRRRRITNLSSQTAAVSAHAGPACTLITLPATPSRPGPRTTLRPSPPPTRHPTRHPSAVPLSGRNEPGFGFKL